MADGEDPRLGITPSANTMLLAHPTAARRLADGGGARAALQAVKREAAFSGFRPRLIERLEALGVARHLGVASSTELFRRPHMRAAARDVVVRDPAFKGGRNYSGQSPRLLSRRGILRRYVYDVLAPELALILRTSFNRLPGLEGTYAVAVTAPELFTAVRRRDRFTRDDRIQQSGSEPVSAGVRVCEAAGGRAVGGVKYGMHEILHGFLADASPRPPPSVLRCSRLPRCAPSCRR